MKNSMLHILTIAIGIIFSKIISYKTGFSYNIFSNQFDLIKIVMDLGIFAFSYTIAYFSLRYLFKGKQMN